MGSRTVAPRGDASNGSGHQTRYVSSRHDPPILRDRTNWPFSDSRSAFYPSLISTHVDQHPTIRCSAPFLPFDPYTARNLGLDGARGVPGQLAPGESSRIGPTQARTCWCSAMSRQSTAIVIWSLGKKSASDIASECRSSSKQALGPRTRSSHMA